MGFGRNKADFIEPWRTLSCKTHVCQHKYRPTHCVPHDNVHILSSRVIIFIFMVINISVCQSDAGAGFWVWQSDPEPDIYTYIFIYLFNSIVFTVSMSVVNCALFVNILLCKKKGRFISICIYVEMRTVQRDDQVYQPLLDSRLSLLGVCRWWI